MASVGPAASRRAIDTTAARLPPALSPPTAMRVGSIASAAALRVRPARRGDGVVHRRGKAVLGTEAIVDRDHRAHREVGELAARHVVRLEVADGPAAAVEEHQRRQHLAVLRSHGTVVPHADAAGVEILDAGDLGRRARQLAARLAIQRTRRRGVELRIRRDVGARGAFEQRARLRVELHATTATASTSISRSGITRPWTPTSVLVGRWPAKYCERTSRTMPVDSGTRFTT